MQSLKNWKCFKRNEAGNVYLHSHFHPDINKNLVEPISHWAGLEPTQQFKDQMQI